MTLEEYKLRAAERRKTIANISKELIADENRNVDLFMAHWVAQNPDADFDDYEFCTRIHWDGGVVSNAYSMRKKQ